MSKVFFIKIAHHLFIISQGLVTTCTDALWSSYLHSIQNLHSSWIFTTVNKYQRSIAISVRNMPGFFVQLLPRHRIY